MGGLEGPPNTPPTPGTAVERLLLLYSEVGERFVGLGQRLGVLAAIVQALRLVELGDRPLHLGVVLVHLRGGLAALLDDLRAGAGEGDTARQREADGDGRDGQELLHADSPPRNIGGF